MDKELSKLLVRILGSAIWYLKLEGKELVDREATRLDLIGGLTVAKELVETDRDAEGV